MNEFENSQTTKLILILMQIILVQLQKDSCVCQLKNERAGMRYKCTNNKSNNC